MKYKNLTQYFYIYLINLIVMSNFDCIVCFENYRETNQCTNRCPNSSDHKICMDCYVQIAFKCTQDNENFCCPYCRCLIQKVESINLSSDELQRIFPKNITSRNGKRHGLTEIFFMDGSIMERINYSNNKRHGKTIQYYPNGSIRSEFNYFGGKLQGVSRMYYFDGKLQIECHYKQDKLHGIYKKWNNEGFKILHNNYKNGKLDGECFEYFYEASHEWEILDTDGNVLNTGAPIIIKECQETLYRDNEVINSQVYRCQNIKLNYL